MGYLTSLDNFFLCAFGHIFASFAYCSVKHGYVVWIDDIVRNNQAHEALAQKEKGEKGGAVFRDVEKLPDAIPGLISWAGAICRGLPAYICGGAWAGLNLHQRLDLVVMITLSITYVISSAILLVV